MNRLVRAILGVIFVGIITFSAISIFQNMGRSMRLDITDQKVYTLSDGTKAILGKLNQPINLKLYYAKTAAMKAPDQIKYFNNYYYFVRALLEEYERQSNGMVRLSVIDPRPFSEDEEAALRYKLRDFPITEEEKFFFGLVVQTPFGVTKSMPFFSPDRQNFVEYEISYLIDTAISREKKKIGVLSSLPVMGDDVSGYMAQMMQMQGKRPKPPWTIVRQLRQKYEVTKVETEVKKIEGVEILLVVHPKELPEKTLWAIDQFVLGGGRTIVCVDPHAVVDMPSPQQRMMGQMTKTSSDLNRLLKTWGLEQPESVFAGDRGLALRPLGQPMQMLIYAMDLKPGCFNTDNIITAELNQVRMLFSGVLKPLAETDFDSENQEIEITPLLSTTEYGNTWKAEAYELTMMMDPARLLKKFTPGSKPVNMGYMVTGQFKSSFPEGIEVEESAEADNPGGAGEQGADEAEKKTRKLTGLSEGEDCAVVVFADVDFISDIVAYKPTFLGAAPVGDNATLLLNTIENLSGSGDLISVRSRGNFQRPFKVVDDIEKEAEKETAAEEEKINAQIIAFQQKLSGIVAEARKKGENVIDASELEAAKAEPEREIRKLQRELRNVQNRRREKIETLGNQLRAVNMLAVPGAILVAAIILGIYRATRRRHYISHFSDA